MSDSAATSARPMGMVEVTGPDGQKRLEWRALPPPRAGGRKKARRVPDPLIANPEASAERLRSMIERRERLLEEAQGIADDIADAKAEEKALGYDSKAITQIIAMRKADPGMRAEFEQILETYKTELGLL